IKGAVITSGKKSGFLAGADLRMLGGGGITGGATDKKELFARLFNLNAMLRKLETSGRPAKKLMSGEAS
ncbi:MAG TPA: hypothetical protein DEA50_06060, partial [Parvularcula sp.]|nr:hypothetical protein [Parvularcula sp.]